MVADWIEETPYNSRWWGAAYGRVRQDAFFELPRAEISKQLASFSVVEYSAPDLDAAHVEKLRALGFWRSDTQIPFRISLSPFSGEPQSKRLRQIVLQSAAETPFAVAPEDMPTFEAERFWQLRGVTEAQVGQRFSNWCADIVRDHPQTSFALFFQGTPIGWFLGRLLNETTIELTLAMGHPDARGMGMLVYEAALYRYAQAGFRVGQAAFSVSNPNVLNIYAGLGARFQSPRHIWLWQAP